MPLAAIADGATGLRRSRLLYHGADAEDGRDPDSNPRLQAKCNATAGDACLFGDANSGEPELTRSAAYRVIDRLASEQ